MRSSPLSKSRDSSSSFRSKLGGAAGSFVFLAFALLIMMLVTAIASRAQSDATGKDLFNQHCASCHFTETTAQKIGPGLKGLYKRQTFADGKKITDATVTRWIEAGGKDMPGFKESLKPEQLRALISYLKTL
jgi:mono/diheme cytochrome c family protein